MEKIVKFYYCHFLDLQNTSVKRRHSVSQISDCTCVVLFFCYLSMTVAHLLLDDIEHAVAYFALI